jgi:hypothetical protein
MIYVYLYSGNIGIHIHIHTLLYTGNIVIILVRFLESSAITSLAYSLNLI